MLVHERIEVLLLRAQLLLEFLLWQNGEIFYPLVPVFALPARHQGKLLQFRFIRILNILQLNRQIQWLARHLFQFLIEQEVRTLFF